MDGPARVRNRHPDDENPSVHRRHHEARRQRRSDCPHRPGRPIGRNGGARTQHRRDDRTAGGLARESAAVHRTRGARATVTADHAPRRAVARVRRSRTSEEYQHAIEQSLRSARKLKDLTEDLLSLARLGADKERPRTSSTCASCSTKPSRASRPMPRQPPLSSVEIPCPCPFAAGPVIWSACSESVRKCLAPRASPEASCTSAFCRYRTPSPWRCATKTRRPGR